MIDFIKINDLSSGATIQDLLDFELKVNHRTGEEMMNRKRSAYLRNLVFTVTPGERFVKIQGSLHKYLNGGDLNNDRFTFDRFLKVADDLAEYISDNDSINVLEFGVNVQTESDPCEFIDNLIAHLKKPFSKTIISGECYAQVRYEHYLMKIYDKSLQQPSATNVLRIEVKYLRMQKLFPDGLKWSYLRDINTWLYLGEILRKKFSEVIYYDPSINLKSIPVKESQFIKDGRNSFYWQDLNGPHVSRMRKQYQKLIRKYGSQFNNLPELLDQEIKEVVKSYRNFNQVNVMENSVKNTEVVKSYTLLYGNNSPTVRNEISDHVCKVTGIDISMQRSGSKFLCISGVRFLYENDREVFDKIKNERLSAKWLRYPVEIQFREIAHSIRNEYYNPKNNTKQSLRKILKDPVLFEVIPTIEKNKRILAGI